MRKEDILTLKSDIESLKRTRRVVKELILNFPDDSKDLCHQEEFIQLSIARICLDKIIIRMQHLLEKVS